jgi:NAD(P)-dependent dehydrogenase (short-subunit alcohol dehydrogenase family)
MINGEQNMPDHNKRVALVTGANRGIGYAISRRLGEQNITVILGARDPNKGTEACSRLRGEGLDVHFELLDVTDHKSIKAAIESIRTHFGRLDILVKIRRRFRKQCRPTSWGL